MNNAQELDIISRSVRERFEAQKSLLTFREYIDLFTSDPGRYSRDAARYVRDCFDYFGEYTVERAEGPVTRWRLFDAEFETQGVKRHRLEGQEDVQNRIVQLLTHFVHEGRANRLILLHGPNGSAKSTAVACIFRALEYYSAQPEGALYRFSWVFSRKADDKTIGFSGGRSDAKSQGRDPDVDARLISELREHPLLLLPTEQRMQFIEKTYAEHGITLKPPAWLTTGQLGHKNAQIWNALMTAYRGDLDKVLSHIHVERYYMSKQYHSASATIGPEMAVDAHERQITADLSRHALPAALSSVTLFEVAGDLVDASGGLLEYSDLLKRPLDAWKYLLLAIETGEVTISNSIVLLNMVMMASSNELHLQAFRQHPEYASFRGRIQLVRMPYLLDYSEEKKVYDYQVVPQLTRHIAPHTTWALGMWGVLTRLRRPDVNKFDSHELGRLALSLTPIEKAELYSSGKVPARFGAEEAGTLQNGVKEIREASSSNEAYEGLTGASPRELRSLLLDAAESDEFEYVSPLAVFERLRAFCERSEYEFLQEPVEQGYHDALGFVDHIEDAWIERVDEEFRRATGLLDDSKPLELFDRYVTHVSFWVKKERIFNKVTGRDEDPDEEFMRRFEGILGAGQSSEDFRKNLISVVAGHAIDYPGRKVDYAQLFPRYLARSREHYFQEHKAQVLSIAKHVLGILNQEPQSIELDPESKTMAERSIAHMKNDFGYERSSLRDALTEVIKRRYSI